MLVFGLISPHPPIILPEIGGDELVKVNTTIQALTKAVGKLAQAKPEKLIIISPHKGHGFQVPERFLSLSLPEATQVEEIFVTEPSYQYYFDYGKEVGARIAGEAKRYAVVASADLSHVLKEDGPYGFNVAGPVLDKQIVEAVGRRDAAALLEIDPKMLDEGAECGLRSILFLLGAMEGAEAQTEVLSYEGPLGVGYLVATFEPTLREKGAEIIDLARKSIRHYLETGKSMRVPEHLPELLLRPAGAFVSLHERDGALRGCIGTVSPTKANLAEEVAANAILAATGDSRFETVSLDELGTLEVSVDVLGEPEVVKDALELDPKRYGVILTARDGRRGVLLPDLDGVDSVDEQLRICREKGKIEPEEAVQMARFEVERWV